VVFVAVAGALDGAAEVAGAAVGAGAAVAAGAAAAADVVAAAAWLLSTPPWPLQAPFPEWLFVPSLQVTSAAVEAPAAAEVPDAAVAAGAAAALDDASVLAAAESFDLEAFFGFDSLAAAASPAAPDALLSTPPWPLHAPFPE
jgi:hypothetical protein